MPGPTNEPDAVPQERPRAVSNEELFRVNLRDALRCRRCGRGPACRETYHRGFEYHHLVHWADGGPNVAENLILLCRDCHASHHDGDVDDFPASAGDPPTSFACAACGKANDPRRIEVNCGWYRCDACRERVHLFDHFGYVEVVSSGTPR